MKRFMMMLACLFMAGAACAQDKPATLNFKFTGQPAADAQIIRIFAPAVYAERNMYEIDPNHGNATLTVPVDGITAAFFYYGRRTVVFYIEPSKTYNITIADAPSGVEISIDDEALQRYLDISKGWEMYKYDSGSDYAVAPLDASGKKMMENFERLIAEDQARLEGVDMDPEMKRVLEKDIELYHITCLSMAIRQDWWRNGWNVGRMFPDYIETWDRLFEKYPLSPDYRNSYYLSDYASQYAVNYLSLKNGIDRGTLTMEDYIELYYPAIEDDDLKERILTAEINMQTLGNTDHDDYIVPLINKFLEHYPENGYRPDLEQHLTAIQEWKNDPRSNFTPDMKLVDGYEELKSMEEVIAKFKGKPIFIDFWFITCVHCIVEFGQSDGLKKFLKENGIEMLYMARENKSKDTQWMNAILRYGLTGNHVRMSPELTKDFNDNYNVRGYPQYMIVNADGRIVIADALRPSSGEALENQIKEALGL